MNLGGKDLDGLLKNWRSPVPGQAKGAVISEQDEERNWDERADAIVKAALAAKPSAGDVLGALMAAPPLAAEAGDDGAASGPKPRAPAEPREDATSPQVISAGEKKMSQEK